MDTTDTTDTPDLLASTGTNDPSSPWNGLLFTALSGGVSAGTSALNRALGNQTPITGTAASSGAPAVGSAVLAPAPTSKTGMGLLIVATILGIIVLFFIGREK